MSFESVNPIPYDHRLLTLRAKQRAFLTTNASKAAALLAMIVAISGVITTIFYYIA